MKGDLHNLILKPALNPFRYLALLWECVMHFIRHLQKKKYKAREVMFYIDFSNVYISHYIIIGAYVYVYIYGSLVLHILSVKRVLETVAYNLFPN